MKRTWLCVLALLAAVSTMPAVAQIAILPVVITTVGELPAAPVDGRPYVVVDGLTESDCDRDLGGGGTHVHWCLYDADAGSYAAVAGGAGTGDIEAVGDCATGSCFQATTATHVLAAPVSGGVAAFRALTDADIPNTITVDLATAATSATTATTATTANAGDSATGFFPSGTIEHERGGLEADVSLYAGLVAISGGLTSNVTNLAGLNTTLGSSIADGAHTTDTTRTDEEIQDVAGAMVTGNTESGIAVTYQDADGTLDFVLDTLGGDATGPLTAIVVGDDSHAHTDSTVADAITVSGGAVTNSDLTLKAGTAPTVEGRTEWNTTTDRLLVGDGIGTQTFVPGEHTVEANDLTSAVTWANVPDANIPAGIARDSEVPSLETDPGVPLLSLADLGDLCAGGEGTRRNVGDTANECYTPASADGVGYDEILDEATGLTKRAQVNFTGAGVSCADNAGATRTDCTIAGGSPPAFSDITSGTNSTAAMVVGAGSSLKAASTGTIDASGIDADGDGTRELSATSSLLTSTVTHRFTGSVITTAQAVDRIDLGVQAGTPRLVFENNGQTMWVQDVESGDFRLYTPGTERFRFTTSYIGATVPLEWGASNPASRDVGIKRDAAGRLAVTNASSGVGGLRAGTYIADPSTATCADDGTGAPGAVTITPTTSKVHLTNLDPHSCTVTLSESGAVSGQLVTIIVVSNAGGTVDFADAPTVAEMSGPFSMDLWDVLRFDYTVDRWVESGRVNN